MNIQMVYMTAANVEEARTIGRTLVAGRLAACVNIVEPMTAIYMWEGALQEEGEVVLIAKTVAWKVPQLIETIRRMHSYAVPCIVTLPVTGGHEPFLDWVAGETRASGELPEGA
ncbi:MAG: divalent-cation tolerance protein CutA [Desulfobacteraceae bacterium]|nr:divalent-cation tolerance protein CutA [Desulfobacteraceae bacterium]